MAFRSQGSLYMHKTIVTGSSTATLRMSLAAFHFRIPTTQASFPSFAPLAASCSVTGPAPSYEFRILCILHSCSSLGPASMPCSLVSSATTPLRSRHLPSMILASLRILPAVPHGYRLRPAQLTLRSCGLASLSLILGSACSCFALHPSSSGTPPRATELPTDDARRSCPLVESYP